MEKRIYEAAVEGSVISLLNLLHEDPLILDRVTINSYGETPLLVASMLGHAEFVQEILKRKPELATEVDSQKSAPLHLATAKGYVNIVKNLVSVNPDMCFALDRNGRNPLHIAAMKGHVDVLRQMFRVRPTAARICMDRKETILHVCVRYYQLETMTYLIETMQDREFLNSKDDDGNTILHLAVAEKQIEAVKFLTACAATEVNSLNVNGFTALDILKQSKRDIKDWEIGESLQRAGAISSRDIDATAETRTLKSHANYHIAVPAPKGKNAKTSSDGEDDWLDKMSASLMVVASLIATMAFQAGVNPPGGVWQENLDPTSSEEGHRAGASIFGDEFENAHQIFSFFNTTSFVSSLSVILILISGLRILNRKYFMWSLMIITWIAITALAIAYMISLACISYSDRYSSAPIIALFIWFGVVGSLVVVHTIRLIRGKTRQRRRSSSIQLGEISSSA